MPETPEVRVIESFHPLFRDLLEWWHVANVKGVIIGGVAASLLGRARTTHDVDALLLVDRSEWISLLEIGATFGFGARIDDAIEFANQSRVLLLHHLPTQTDVDISFGALPFEEELVQRAIQFDIDTLKLPLPTREDLIIMKAIARRPRDKADIEGILDAASSIDLQRIRVWLREFAELLETPEIIADFEVILRASRQFD